jgi:hypothetical protein
MEIKRDRFKKRYPSLAREMETKRQKVAIGSVRSSFEAGERVAAAKKNLSQYSPDAIDFIRRCDNEQQAEEIISYLENRGEITTFYAQKLRRQLRRKGVRSFGSKKESGYYFTQGRH